MPSKVTMGSPWVEARVNLAMGGVGVLAPRQQLRSRCFLPRVIDRRRPSRGRCGARLAPPITALFRAEASDFELLRTLGTVSYAVDADVEKTLTWRGGDDGSVPDSFAVLGAGGASVAGDAVMKLYAGKVVGWDDGQERSNAVPDVLLK